MAEIIEAKAILEEAEQKFGIKKFYACRADTEKLLELLKSLKS